MTIQPAEEHLAIEAHRQAGHALMAYLILMAGVADHFFALPIQPPDRAHLVPAFDHVSLEVDLSRADRPSASLRSLITTPLFLMGGEAAERIYRGLPLEAPLGNSTALSRARGMMYGYMEEFGGRGSPDSDARLAVVFQNYYEFVEGQLRSHWESLSALARALQHKGRVTGKEAFDVIGRHLPDETRMAVASLGGG